VVTCAAPCLAHPRSTIGLGDTFLAGTLLVLGQGERGVTPHLAARPELLVSSIGDT
jgi:hypothetical protein